VKDKNHVFTECQVFVTGKIQGRFPFSQNFRFEIPGNFRVKWKGFFRAGSGASFSLVNMKSHWLIKVSVLGARKQNG